jgi:hypothetical protein
MLKLALRANQTSKMENAELNQPVRPLLCSHEFRVEEFRFRVEGSPDVSIFALKLSSL